MIPLRRRLAERPLIVRDSFLLPFRGSEIWCVELDGLGSAAELVREKFAREIEYAHRPSTTSAVILHFKDTQLTPDIIHLIAEGLNSPNIRRAALVGVAKPARSALAAALERLGGVCAYRFINDYEKAKEWLIP